MDDRVRAGAERAAHGRLARRLKTSVVRILGLAVAWRETLKGVEEVERATGRAGGEEAARGAAVDAHLGECTGDPLLLERGTSERQARVARRVARVTDEPRDRRRVGREAQRLVI